jgi:serine/threonine protein kinase
MHWFFGFGTGFIDETQDSTDMPYIQLYTYQAFAAFREFSTLIVMHVSPSPVQENSDALTPGTALQNGALTITRILAISHFAITYVARDEALQREVAVKEFFPFGSRRAPSGEVIPPQLSKPEEFNTARAQFLEEARVLAQFHHPGVVSVHSFFQSANTAYMVMELLHGATLRELLETKGRFHENEILALARKIGVALQAVHDAGLLHRDIKPDNIFACDDGRIVLLDFGLSTRLEFDAYGTRRLDSLLRFGTPGYAPPEQYTHGATQNAASDVYSLAATLYHLLTGTAPPPATDRAFGVALEPPSRIVAGISPAIEYPLLCALQLDAGQRPQTATDFGERLSTGAQLLATRTTFLAVLEARCQQLQLAGEQLAPNPAASTNRSASRQTQQLPPEEESGCMLLFFGAYIAFWLVGIVICIAWFAIMFFFVRW